MTLYTLHCHARENGSGICGPSQEDGVCRRFGYNSREPTRTTGSVGGTERGVQEARTENEPGEDRSDVGWTVRRSSKSMALCTLDERLRRMGIQR